MSATTQLRAEHRWLEGEAAKLLHIASAPTPDSAAVAAIRWRLVQALREHCAREDALVEDWLTACSDGKARTAVSRHREAHGRISEFFMRYVSQWPVARLASEWDGFCAETHAVVAGLAARFAAEELELHPHAERVHARREAA